MQTTQYHWSEIGVCAEVSCFESEASLNEVVEYHVMLHVLSAKDLFEAQYDRLRKAEALLFQEPKLQGMQVVLKRVFLSDAANQASFLPNEVCLSCIQQPPLDGSKIAEWLYLQKGSQVSHQKGCVVVDHNGYRHLFQGRMLCSSGDSYTQTKTLLAQYGTTLQGFSATLSDHCLRTWFFVRDVDTQYAGLVKARREYFAEQGLNAHTHFIASTGIGGVPESGNAIVQMGAYALMGFAPEQLRYLQALSHMSPTAQYGVTFERGTLVEYGDRAQIFVSGTASIDSQGQVMHVGDIVGQTKRMWENVDCLLAEGNAGLEDIAQMIVYLRDGADYAVVKEMFERKFPGVPKVITLAPICRPSWLIEMECIAVVHRDNSKYRNF